MHSLDVIADVLDDRADVCRPDEHRGRRTEHLTTPFLQLRPATHRVLELGAVGLHGIRGTRGTTDGAAEKHVIAEEKICRQVLAHGRGVRVDPGVELVA